MPAIPQNTKAVCEGCNEEKVYEVWPVDWVMFGQSRFGKKQNKYEIAWWCDECFRKGMALMEDNPNVVYFLDIRERDQDIILRFNIKNSWQILKYKR